MITNNLESPNLIHGVLIILVLFPLDEETDHAAQHMEHARVDVSRELFLATLFYLFG